MKCSIGQLIPEPITSKFSDLRLGITLTTLYKLPPQLLLGQCSLEHLVKSEIVESVTTVLAVFLQQAIPLVLLQEIQMLVTLMAILPNTTPMAVKPGLNSSVLLVLIMPLELVMIMLAMFMLLDTPMELLREQPISVVTMGLLLNILLLEP